MPWSIVRNYLEEGSLQGEEHSCWFILEAPHSEVLSHHGKILQKAKRKQKRGQGFCKKLRKKILALLFVFSSLFVVFFHDVRALLKEELPGWMLGFSHSSRPSRFSTMAFCFFFFFWKFLAPKLWGKEKSGLWVHFFGEIQVWEIRNPWFFTGFAALPCQSVFVNPKKRPTFWDLEKRPKGRVAKNHQEATVGVFRGVSFCEVFPPKSDVRNSPQNLPVHRKTAPSLLKQETVGGRNAWARKQEL